MKNIFYLFISALTILMFSCKTKDVNKYSKKDYIQNQYKELKEILPEAQVSILNDTIKVLFPNNLLFKTAEYQLNDSTIVLMERLAKCVNKYHKTSIIVCGHTDNVGNAESNQTLSQKRAEAAMNILLNNKVTKERISAWGFGDRQPISTANTDSGRALNRRVEFVILIDDTKPFRK